MEGMRAVNTDVLKVWSKYPCANKSQEEEKEGEKRELCDRMCVCHPAERNSDL